MSNRGLLTAQSTAVKTSIENEILAGPRLKTELLQLEQVLIWT